MVRQKQNFLSDSPSTSANPSQQIVGQLNKTVQSSVNKSGQLNETVQSSVKKRIDNITISKKKQNELKNANDYSIRKAIDLTEVIDLDEMSNDFFDVDLNKNMDLGTQNVNDETIQKRFLRMNMSNLKKENIREYDRNRKRGRTHNEGLYLKAGVFDISKIKLYKIGELNVKCNHCPAIHFPEEQSKTHGINEFYECCNYGKLSNLEELLQEYPIELRILFQPELDNDNYTEIREFNQDFKKNLRVLNSSFSCASLGCMRFKFGDKNVPIFKIQGSVYHSYNTFAQPDNTEELPTNGQLYFIDTDQAIDCRLNALNDRVLGDSNNKLIALIAYIENYLRENYIYSKSYEMMKNIYETLKATEYAGVDIPDVTMVFDIREGTDLRRYNIPRSNEVCAIIWRDSNDDIPPANIVVHSKGSKKIKTIFPLSKIVEPMCYPLFYPLNYQGWHYDLKNLTGKKISLCDFTKYKLFFRINGKFLPHHYSGKLFQQWCVDQAARIEWDRLNYIKLHQKEICKETYSAVDNFLRAKAIEQNAQVKKQIILPSSFSGGPRYMHENFMDAMTIVKEVGRPDLFLTFTCNPKDEDIQKCLLPGQQTYDRPDIVARVFHLKVNQFLKEITEGEIFGKVIGFCYTIEFQKRGLPHLHMLLTLDPSNKMKNTEDIDKFITAEIPEKNDEEIYGLVTAFMIHGPCGPDFPNAVCWCNKKNKCNKKFPKQFREKTEINENGYPLYKRPNNGRVCVKKDWKTGKNKVMTNQNVVPYNRYLLVRFKSHINVEKVADIKAVKYIYKYIFKGYDAATLRCVSNENGNLKELIYDEAGNYLDARYLSPVEACWKIFKFPLQGKSHSVQRLPVHLENEQVIFFEENDDEETIKEKKDKKSKLMAYFDFFKENPGAPEYLYTEMPKYCTWNSKKGKWLLRKNEKTNKTLGRMYPVSPTEGEKYYLRYLLLHIHGTSFEALKTVNGILYNTFAKACLAQGLIKNDEEWKNCLSEASHFKFPSALRSLFASILLFGDPKYPENLWEQFKNDLAEDYLKNFPLNNAYKLALSSINKFLINEGKSLADFKTMPREIFQNTDEEETIDYEEEKKMADDKYKFMNDEQKVIYDTIKKVVTGQINQKLIYIDGPGGTGKSYILNALYNLIRGYKKRVINMAFSGIAATLLKNGRTIHNRFKFPLNLNAQTVSGIIPNTKAAEEILKTDFFIIDEAPMAPKFALDAIEKKLRELTKKNVLFGGKTIILAGDFRQTLPVKKFALRSEIVDLTIKKSIFWKYFEQRKLTINNRAKDKNFAKQILDIGNGENKEESIILSENCIIPNNSNLVDEVYGDIFLNMDFNELKDRVILSPFNDLADFHNANALEKFPGKCVTYLSIDEVETSNNFPITTEVINSFTAPGFPLHELKLKRNCKVMLLRNISIENGLCNGTMLQVIELKEHLLRCIILGGEKNGNEVYIHRITLITEKEFPVPLKRHQFPVRLAFAVTFIKSQGATYNKIGIDWTRQSFSHGQTYVALSRVGSWQQIKVKLSPENINARVDNIVWKEIL